MVAPEGRRDLGDPDGPTASASERAYRALLRAYPEDLRGEYGEEMARAFRDLRRRELERRGAPGLAALWARALPELVFTALKERSTMLARNAYLPVPPRTAARWGTLSALLGGSLGVLHHLAVSAFPVAMWYGTSPGFVFFSLFPLVAAALLSVLGTFGLYGTLAAGPRRPGRLAGVGASLTALSAVSILALGGYAGAEEMAWLWPPDGGYSWWETHRTAVLGAAGLGGWALGLSLLGASAFRARLFGPARALPVVVAALLPATLVLTVLLSRVGYSPMLVDTLPFLGSAVLGWALLRGHGGRGLAEPGRGGPAGGGGGRRGGGGPPGRGRGPPRAARPPASGGPPRRKSCWRLSVAAGGWRRRGRRWRPR